VQLQLLALFRKHVFSVAISSPIALNQTRASRSRIVPLVPHLPPIARGVKARLRCPASLMGTELNALEPSYPLRAPTQARVSPTLIVLPALLMSPVALSVTHSQLLCARRSVLVPLVQLAGPLLLLNSRQSLLRNSLLSLLLNSLPLRRPNNPQSLQRSNLPASQLIPRLQRNPLGFLLILL